MLPHTDLLATLNTLDTQFKTAKNSLEAAFCAKLAVIECCGWTEEAMDEIVTRCSQRCLLVPSNHSLCLRAIKNTYGFDYGTHFRKMLGTLIGLTGLERLERSADSVKLARLEAALSTMKTIRDTHAHTHIKGAIPNLSAPSFVMSQWTPIAEGLREVESRLSQRMW